MVKDNIKLIKTALFGNKSSVKTMKNSFWLIFERIFTMVIGVVVTAMAARYFGPENYGQFNYALAFVSLLSVFATLGLETLSVKALVEKEYSEGTILYSSMVIRIIGGISIAIITYLAIMIMEPNDFILHLLVLIASMTMIIKTLDVIDYWIQAHQKAKIASSIKMGFYIFSSALKLLILFLDGGIILYALVYALDTLLVGLAIFLAYRHIREDKSQWKFDKKYAIEILKKSWYIILSGIMVTIYTRIDQVMLGAIMPSRAELGYYSAAVKIAEMWYFVPQALIISLQPIIMAARTNDSTRYEKLLKILFSLVAWLSIFFGLFITVFAPFIIHLLYGAEYASSAGMLMISVWAGTFALMGSARNIWLISEGLLKYTFYFTVFGAIVNVVMNIILIPIIGGQGAAFATLASQLTVNMIVPYFFKETRGITLMMFKSFTLEVFWKK